MTDLIECIAEEDGAEHCPCLECESWRQNREPGDPDGEAFRGTEAATFASHEQAAWMKLKR